MTRYAGLLLVLVALYCTGFTSAQLDPSESTALLALRSRWFSIVTNSASVYPPWTTNTATACDDGGGLSWGGITCTGGHVTRLELPFKPLNSEFPSEITGLTHLTRVFLQGTGLTGTLPSDLTALVDLTTFRVDANALNLCAHNTSFPAGLDFGSCDARDQDYLSCGPQCCGCNANWVNCQANVSPCTASTCSTDPPTNTADMTCFNNHWVITSSYSGPLYIHGRVTVLGDLKISQGTPLLFFGLDSSLNVTGTLSVQERPIFVLSDDHLKQISGVGRYRSFRREFIFFRGNPTFTRIGYSHTRRSCDRPFASIFRGSVSPSDDYTPPTSEPFYTVSMTRSNRCNSWWIVLAAVLPAVIVGVLGGALPFIISGCR